ncbi:MAG: serine hydrolase [Acidimicrobiales bacterium]
MAESFRARHGAPSTVLAITAGAGIVHLSAPLHPERAGTPAADHPAPGPGTAYRIASMTKSFTAAAVLQLRDRGRLRLDDAVEDHVPELAGLSGPTADSRAVTIRQLASMAGGLASDDPWADRLLDADDVTMDALFRSGATFATAPGTAFVYSNYGYAMLGRVITAAAGRPFQEHITAELLEPLGLAGTGWVPPPLSGAPQGVAPACWLVDGKLVAEPVLADGGFAAMGGLWSTAADIARWSGWLADAFPARDGPDDPVLCRASRREMQQVATAWPPQITADGAGGAAPRVTAGGYGYGLNVALDSRLGFMVQHSGGLPGYGSNMRWLPNRGVGAVALANLRYAPARHLTLAALDLLADAGAVAERPEPPPAELAAAAERLVALLNRWDDGPASELFAFNVDLDEPLARRRQQAAERLAGHGPLAIRSIRAVNRAEADVEVVDGRGHRVLLAIMLSGEPGARIQWYELDEPPPAQPPHAATDEP